MKDTKIIAYQSKVLGVSVVDSFVYAVFNYLSPLMTLFFAAMQIKIKQLAEAGEEEK